MQISLENLGKKYKHEWIFKNLSYSFSNNHKYAITGANGSGKSTLLKVISAFESPSKGEINYSINNKN